MFLPIKSLGSTIGLPFLSANEDNQLQFRTGQNGVKRLAFAEVIPKDDFSYWQQYWTLFDSPTDVYSLITIQDVRTALQHSPRNIYTLINVLSAHLFELLRSPRFPSVPQQSNIPVPSSIKRSWAGGNAVKNGEDPTREALNCVRVLGRVLVVVYENDADGDGVDEAESLGSETRTPIDAQLRDHFAWNTLWKRGSTDYIREESVEAQRGQYTADGSHSDIKQSQSLAEQLFKCTIDLLFCAGFTIPESMKDQQGDKINYVIWEKGVGSTQNIGSSSDLDKNKSEMLLFLCILVSSTIYTPPHALPYATNRGLQYLTHSLERRLVLSLLCSWLNTSLSTHTSNWGEHLPYNHLLLKSGEDRRTLVKMSLMSLLVVLDHWEVEPRSPTETPSLTSLPGSSTSSFPAANIPEREAKKSENAFRYFITKLHRKEDFSFILDGILANMADHTSVRSNVLPGSKRPVTSLSEVFMLFWRLIDLNKRFRIFFTDSGKTTDVVGYIVLCCLEMKDNPAQQGLLRMLSYILQTLSSDPSFGPALNEPLRIDIPSKWIVPGFASDFLVVSILSIATAPGLNSLFPALAITLSNIAPYLQGVGFQASIRLLQLFKAFSAPGFILADEGHPRLLIRKSSFFRLEAFNGVLSHRLRENPNIVYAILLHHQDFQKLATFTLTSGLAEIQRKMLARAAAAVQSPSDSKEHTRSLFDTTPSSEKASLTLQQQSRESADFLTSPTTPYTKESSITTPLFTPGEAEEDPLASAEANAHRAQAKPLSDKAKGKRRMSSGTIGGDGHEELQQLALQGIGPNGYIPTAEWVASWQKGLPLDLVLIAISELLPQVQAIQPLSSAGPNRNVVDHLRTVSLKDVLPPHSTHTPRKFQWSVASTVWLTSLLWGDIYVQALPNFSGTSVKLFGVRQAAPSRREQAIQNVSNRLMSFVGGGATGSTVGGAHPGVGTGASSSPTSRRTSTSLGPSMRTMNPI
ncbi:hypothetical protein QFC19_008866 [Naganishia cerealis]|uniref:Uncharacterized protein n=1 Tax=Naganishia cerealis TaxID=610337 RepID=A0ACC2UYT9_9TREE|nr:hypothetical protein QFC19_008866 [Naganishia cerealis]